MSIRCRERLLRKELFEIVSTRLYWVEGPWTGKLALAARPRGGDWLADEIENWRANGTDVVFSLLSSEEERELDLQDEAQLVKARKMQFVSLPIPDRQVPKSGAETTAALEEIDSDLSSGKKVIVHCRQGIGRSGMIAACLLIMKGWTSEAAIESLSRIRGIRVPETVEQRRWIGRYASTLAVPGGTLHKDPVP